MDLAGVSQEVAEEALAKHKEVWLAVDALTERPVVAGDKYIPSKPKVNTGLTSEQEALCQKGRWLQDQVNAVFSVAHSKTQYSHSGLEPEQLCDRAQEDATPAPMVAPPPSPQSDVPEKTTQ